MASHREMRRLSYAADDLFELVSDVRDYPKFINFILGLRVLKEDVENGAGSLTAEAVVQYKFLRERFATDVEFDKSGRRIDVRLVRGPLRALETLWRFHPLSDGSTLVDFRIDYEFSAPLLGRFFEKSKTRAADKIMSAFLKRASQKFSPTGDDTADLSAEIAAIQNAA